MKRFALAALLLSFSASPGTAQVGVGTTTPAPGTALDISSTTNAVLLPRLSTTAMNAIAAPVQGMIIFNIDSTRFYGYGSQGLADVVGVSNTVPGPSQAATATVWQSFTATTDLPFISALEVDCAGNCGTVYSVTLRAGQGTTGTLLASTTKTANTGWVRVVFPSAVALQAGNIYTFQVTATSGPATFLWGSNNNSYTGGGASVGAGNFDLRFQLFRPSATWHALD